jgi:hypothetical protein
MSDSTFFDEGLSPCGKGLAEIEPISAVVNMNVEAMKYMMISVFSSLKDCALRRGNKAFACL